MTEFRITNFKAKKSNKKIVGSVVSKITICCCKWSIKPFNLNIIFTFEVNGIWYRHYSNDKARSWHIWEIQPIQNMTYFYFDRFIHLHDSYKNTWRIVPFRNRTDQCIVNPGWRDEIFLLFLNVHVSRIYRISRRRCEIVVIHQIYFVKKC